MANLLSNRLELVGFRVIGIAQPLQLFGQLRLIRVQPAAQGVQASILVPELGVHNAQQNIGVLGQHRLLLDGCYGCNVCALIDARALIGFFFRALVAHGVIVLLGKVQRRRVKPGLHGFDLFKGVSGGQAKFLHNRGQGLVLFLEKLRLILTLPGGGVLRRQFLILLPVHPEDLAQRVGVLAVEDKREELPEITGHREHIGPPLSHGRVHAEHPLVLRQEDEVDPVAADAAHKFRVHRGAEVGKIIRPALEQPDGIKIDIQRPEPLQIIPCHIFIITSQLHPLSLPGTNGTG